MVAGAMIAVTAAFACGESELGIVRTRPGDGGLDAGEDGGRTVLACGVVVPTTYVSAGFAANAKEELDLKAKAAELSTTMRASEGTSTSVVTSSQLRGIYEAGTPSLRAASTAAAQAQLDAYFTAFGDAVGKAWTPAAADADGGAAQGGKYENGSYVSATGIDLRPAIEETLLAGAFYNHALLIASGPVTEGAVDRLVASFGATALADRSDIDAGAGDAALLAGFAWMRDDPSEPTGPYRRMRAALLAAKAAAAAGASCKGDLDAALAVFFATWERATYASAIYYLNDAASNALAQPPRSAAALRSFGQAAGFVQSFRGVAQDRRKITDGEIEEIAASIGVATAYQLVTRTSERVPKLVEAILRIGRIFEFSSVEVERYKKAF